MTTASVARRRLRSSDDRTGTAAVVQLKAVGQREEEDDGEPRDR